MLGSFLLSYWQALFLPNLSNSKGVFRTLSNIWDGAFCESERQKANIVNINWVAPTNNNKSFKQNIYFKTLRLKRALLTSFSTACARVMYSIEFWSSNFLLYSLFTNLILPLYIFLYITGIVNGSIINRKVINETF